MDFLTWVGIRCIWKKHRSTNTGWFWWENTGKSRKMEAVFRSEIFRIFFGDLRPFPDGKNRKFAGKHREKIWKFSGRNAASTFRGVPVLSCRKRHFFLWILAGRSQIREPESSNLEKKKFVWFNRIRRFPTVASHRKNSKSQIVGT